MKAVNTGAVTVLTPESRKDQLELVKRIQDDEVDVGMDTRGFGKLTAKAKKAHDKMVDEAHPKALKTRAISYQAPELVKAKKPQIHPGVMPAKALAAQRSMAKHLTPILEGMGKKITAVLKSWPGLAKADGNSPDPLIDAILKSIGLDWNKIPEAVRGDIVDAALSGVVEGTMQLDITDDGMLATFNETAKDWADNRAAEMVGKSFDDNGNLVDNPDAKWVISDTTRDDINRIITDAFQSDSPSMQSIIDAIQTAGSFTEARAEMIAKTEVISAEVNSNLAVWRDSGLVQSVDWLLSDDHDDDDECDDLADDGPYAIDEVPDFPAHPFCECVLVASDISEGDVA